MLSILIYLAIKVVAITSAVNDINDSVYQLKNSDFAVESSAFHVHFGHLADAVSTIDSVSHEPALTLLGSLPWWSKDFSAVAETSRAAHQVFEDASPVVDLIAPLRQKKQAGILSGISVGQARTIDRQINRLDASLANASSVLKNWQSQHLGYGMSNKIGNLRHQLGTVQLGLSRATPLIALTLPIVSTSKTWFVANENLAEARGTGGILGSWAIIKVNKGQIKLVASGSDQDLDRLAKVDFGSLPPSLRAVWGVEPSNWRDVNAARHFAYFAEQIRDSLKPKLKIDGVLAIGQGTVARLVSATGAVTVSGVQIDSKNAHDFLAKDIYARFPDVNQKNAFVQKLMLKLFKNLSSQSFDFKSFWKNLVSQEYGDQVYGWSSDRATQRLFEIGGVSGSVSPKFGSKVYLTFNNAGANKLDAYLRVKADYFLGSCDSMTNSGYYGREAGALLEIRNTAPKGLPAYVSPLKPQYFGVPIKVSTNRTLLSIYAPVGSSRLDFTFDDKPIYASEATERGRPVWILDISLTPGKTHKLNLNWIEPTQDADGIDIQAKPEIVAPSAFNPFQISTSRARFCSLR